MKAVRVQRTVATHEHEFEAAPGLPEPLPSGERLLWQGAPDWKLLARHAFHVRKLAVYFALILAARAATAVVDGRDARRLAAVGRRACCRWALIALGLLSLMAWLSARTTRYTLTDRRVVMRVGIVLSLTFNLPLSRIAAADVRLQGTGGDIPLQLAGSDRNRLPAPVAACPALAHRPAGADAALPGRCGHGRAAAGPGLACLPSGTGRTGRSAGACPPQYRRRVAASPTRPAPSPPTPEHHPHEHQPPAPATSTRIPPAAAR